jgi:Fic family protein
MTTKNPYWNWQQPDWQTFTYQPEKLATFEAEFLKLAGLSLGMAIHLSADDKAELIVQLISNEAVKTAEIEGEWLDRASIQSSIKRKFGYATPPVTKIIPQEQGMVEMMMSLYDQYAEQLTHKTLFQWHVLLMSGRTDIATVGAYRTHTDSMQVVSGYLQKPKIHFEAPPSETMTTEMEAFITWFNETNPQTGKTPCSPLIRASIAHLWFVSIHPFEDGNGRIARALVEKTLAQALGNPTLIALSQVIQENRKPYYEELERQNKHNAIDGWLAYFSAVILAAQRYTIAQIEFVIAKAKCLAHHKHRLNERQFKALLRIFEEGVKGFEGGLSAKNYRTITQTSASTATRDLQELVVWGVLHTTGERKATRYYWLPTATQG